MHKSYDNFIKLAIKKMPKVGTDFSALKKELSGELKVVMPTNADLRGHYEEMIKKRKIKRNLQFEKMLQTRKIRTESGVAIIAVLTKSFPCPGQCIYCPTEKGMPKSYLSDEPAVMRAIHSKFDPYHQVQSRLQALELNGHNTDKIELIVMGGTFSFLPKVYQQKFIAECFRAANDYPRKVTSDKRQVTWNILLKEQKRNENVKHRIIGLTLETRPDYIDTEEIINFRKLGCTRVEIGVQNIFDSVLDKNKRGHNVQKTIEATRLLKDAGFKINYHIMPGMYGSSFKKDLTMFKQLFSNPDFQPDMLKIYPTIVVKNSHLYKIWKTKKYQPLTDRQFEKMILEIKNNLIPPYVRIARIIRDVPTAHILAGPRISNLRQTIASRSNCPCIRCREVRSGYDIQEKIVLDRIDYDASDGKEIFLQYASSNKKKLFALLRLRIPSIETQLIASLQNAAVIRELHTYGKLTKINTRDKNSPQHIGLGKKLITEAEKIAKKEFGLQKIAVISGIGVRNYYRQLGYKLKDTYMVKCI